MFSTEISPATRLCCAVPAAAIIGGACGAGLAGASAATGAAVLAHAGYSGYSVASMGYYGMMGGLIVGGGLSAANEFCLPCGTSKDMREKRTNQSDVSSTVACIGLMSVETLLGNAIAQPASATLGLSAAAGATGAATLVGGCVACFSVSMCCITCCKACVGEEATPAESIRLPQLPAGQLPVSLVPAMR